LIAPETVIMDGELEPGARMIGVTTPVLPDGTGVGGCPLTVRRPVMRHRWDRLTFLHWAFDPDRVAPLLPPGLELETVDGQAWVGLVPFFMQVSAPVGGSAPWASRFCETNVRTYVRDARGRSGVWFFSLDAARLPAVLVARGGFHLPYYWSQMSLRQRADTVEYRCRRRWPGAGPTSRVAVRIGPAIEPAQVTPFEHFLTARWRLYSADPGRCSVGDAEHSPWPLHRADLLHLDDRLVAAAGLPAPVGEPLVHYSPGVDVRISGLRPIEAPDPV
jgi:uncharacterized protein